LGLGAEDFGLKNRISMFLWPKKSFQFEEALHVAPWKIRHVQFYQYDSAQVQQAIPHLRYVTHLELGWGQSTVIPVEIASLSKLQHLTILNVALNGFPEAVLGCRSLRELHIRGADIPRLPDALGQLSNLTTLHIGNCGLVELPSCLSQMHYLKALEFPDNRLTQIPSSLSSLPILRQLFLTGNLFTRTTVSDLKDQFPQTIAFSIPDERK
jgi:Leucine-rich repeat (LRR) protein